MSAAVIVRLRERALLSHAERIALAHHVSVEDMVSDSHMSDAVRARHALWTYLHELRHSYASIGVMFGRHHTTVITGVRKHRKLEERSEVLGHYQHERMNGIEARLDALERLSDRLEKACVTLEFIAEQRRAS